MVLAFPFEYLELGRRELVTLLLFETDSLLPNQRGVRKRASKLRHNLGLGFGWRMRGATSEKRQAQ